MITECSDAQSCPTLCNPMECRPPGSCVHGILQGKNTGVGCHFLFQGVFPTQRSNPCFLCLLHGITSSCRQILYHWATTWEAPDDTKSNFYLLEIWTYSSHVSYVCPECSVCAKRLHKRKTTSPQDASLCILFWLLQVCTVFTDSSPSSNIIFFV